MKFLLMFFLLWFQGSLCYETTTEVATSEVSEPTTSFGTGEFSGVIFPATYAEENSLELWAGFFAVDGYWTPTYADVEAFEADLEVYLETQNDARFSSDTPIWERLTEYKRQYAGFVVEGEQILYANFFCSENEDWQSEFVTVDDGGECYFSVQYNPTTHTYSNLYVNGEA